MILLLGGLPGSGKSSFCKSLQETGKQRWSRISQDTISNGGSGSLDQCIQQSHVYLKKSYNILIDTSNLSVVQRADFIKLSKLYKCPIHIVFLDYPVDVCRLRAGQRGNHVGGAERKVAELVVNGMRKMKTLPTLDEGFSRVTICTNDDDYDMALKLYSDWGGDSQLEDGLYSGSTSNKCSVNPGVKRKAPDDLENGTKAENEGGFSRATRPRGNVDPNDNWADRLHFITEDPDKFPDQVLDYDSVAVVVKDLFPKAEKHILILARSDVHGILSLGREHLPMLEHMHSLAVDWVKKMEKEDQKRTFRIGYHLVPSMNQLHLHVISQDFNSPRLKKWKHWNAFNTPCFVESEELIGKIKDEGKWPDPGAKQAALWLSQELRCHKCKVFQPNSCLVSNPTS